MRDVVEAPGGKVVEHDDFVPLAQQVLREMTADEACPPVMRLSRLLLRFGLSPVIHRRLLRILELNGRR